LIVAQVVTTCIAIVTTALWLRTWHDLAQLHESVRRAFCNREKRSWYIVSRDSPGKQEVAVQIGDSRRLTFAGSTDWTGSLPTSGGQERVVVTIDGAEVFNKILDYADGPCLDLQIRDGTTMVNQAFGIEER
jgi:hypothetical protein